MNRKEYDGDVTTFSPDGRLFQVEYAMRAVENGTACLGLRSDTHVVLAGLKRKTSELATHPPKIVEIDSHCGMAISGMTADGRTLSRVMRNECLHHKFVYGEVRPLARMIADLADKHQRTTHGFSRRPYGVGLLVAGYDQTGPKLFETCPSGRYTEWYATAIGARTQAARTYLERRFEEFPAMPLEELTRHAVVALAGTLPSEESLTVDNVDVCVVGRDCDFRHLSKDELQVYLDMAEVAGAGAGAAGDAAEAAEGDEAAAMETS